MMPPEDRQALEWSQQVHHIIMPLEDRHGKQKPHWYLEASCKPQQMNTQNEAIGCGFFFKRWPYDYTNKEFNLPQEHEDRICMVDLLPADRHRSKQEDNNSSLPTDWLEHTGELHPTLDLSFSPGTFKSLAMGDNMTQYGNFYSGVTRHFQMVRAQETHAHDLEMKKAIQTLQDMNSRCNLTPDAGVAKLKEEQNQALKDHVEDIMTRV